MMCIGSMHIYIFSGAGTIPDGWTCACGMMKKKTCSHCNGTGQFQTNAQPQKENESWPQSA